MMRDNSQIKAIKAPVNDSSLIVAPPGYGKTYVMTQRIEYLLNTGALKPPKRLLGLTFTNAAASEMKERVSQTISHRKVQIIDLSTIHSFCYQVLCAYGAYISISQEFTLMSESEIKKILIDIASGNNVDFISNYDENYKKYQEWSLERLLKRNINYMDLNYNLEFERIYQQYMEYCLEQNKFDFDHILIFIHKLFVQSPEVLEIYRSTYSHILVDEFQDTNPLQFEILALLIEGNPSSVTKLDPLPIFFFGDKDQAIYEFMGATPENVDAGAFRFGCTLYPLEINHRTSSPKILELSSSLRSDITTLPSTIPTPFHVYQNETDEAIKVREEIERLSLPLHRICIIAPNKYRLNAIRESLNESISIPYVFIPDFSGAGMEAQFSNIFNRLRTIPATGSSLYKEIKSETNNSSEDGDRDVLQLMINMARSYDINFSTMKLRERANNFLNHILLEVNWGHLVRQTIKGKIFVSTIHGVKGLEFDHVIICGLENYTILHASTCFPCYFGRNRLHHEKSISEAERLLYVGVTRSVEDISLYSVQTASNGRQRKVSCLVHQIKEHIQTDTSVDLALHMCGYHYL
jgi:DNA helicase-2/ATP-dependent DNA helicase PcrA